MTDKLDKRDKKTTGLVKASGAPDLLGMKKKKGSITPVSDKLKLKTGSKIGSSQGVSTVPLQVVFMFDVTGSMYRYFDVVRKKLEEIVTAVKEESPGVQFAVFAYRNHGDEDSFDQIYYTSPLTDNLEEIFGAINLIKKGGGGPDALTCMEECLRDANKLPWDYHASKAIVIIGDMPPHGVVDSISKCYQGINYRDEVDELIDRLIKLYTVFCPTHNNERIREFYQSLAVQGNGNFLEISEIEILKELLIGICMKESGNFDKFQDRLKLVPNLSTDQKKKILALKS